MTTDVLTFSKNGTEHKPAVRDIVLLGYAETTREMVNALPPSVSLWGINMASVFVKRKMTADDYWFQLHPRDWASSGGQPTGYFGRPKEHFEFLQKFPGTVWLMEEDAEIPNGKAFPFDEVVRHFDREYFTSTFAYQMALALWEHQNGKPIRRMYVYGIDLTALEEYSGQRPCAEYWIGRMEQAGIDVSIPLQSALLKGATYPRRGEPLVEHAQTRLQHYKGQYTTAYANATTALAMQTEVKHWTKYLSRLAEKYPNVITEEMKRDIQEHINKRYDNFQAMANQYIADLNGVNGVVKDCAHFLLMLGGQDMKAAALPELRSPAPELEEDFDIPREAKRI